MPTGEVIIMGKLLIVPLIKLPGKAKGYRVNPKVLLNFSRLYYDIQDFVCNKK